MFSAVICLPLNNAPIGGTAVLPRSLLCSSSTMSGMQSVLTNAQLKASPLKDPMLTQYVRDWVAEKLDNHSQISPGFKKKKKSCVSAYLAAFLVTGSWNQFTFHRHGIYPSQALHVLLAVTYLLHPNPRRLPTVTNCLASNHNPPRLLRGFMWSFKEFFFLNMLSSYLI